MIVHKSIRKGSIGGIDNWGYGSFSSYYETPSLGIEWRLTSSNGGIIGPNLGLLRYPPEEERYLSNGSSRNIYRWKGDYPDSQFQFYFQKEGRFFVRSDEYSILEFSSENECLEYLKNQ